MQSQSRWRWLILCAWPLHALSHPDDEVVFKLGEPYEQLRAHSRSTLPPFESRMGFAGIDRPAKFRFDDPVFGFTTPAAKFLLVDFDSRTSRVQSVVLTPQVKDLSLDEAMATLTDVQGQLQRGGWTPFKHLYARPIVDTPEARRWIRACSNPTAYWNGGEQYQLSLDLRCSESSGKATPDRYVITIDLGSPWMPDQPDE